METAPTQDSKQVQELASVLHEDWKKEYREQNPEAKDRNKTFKEGKWVNGTDGANTVDLLNTNYNDLPPYWQKENLEAARVAMGLVQKRLQGGPEVKVPSDLLYDAEWLNEAADKVHQEWSKRNSWDEKAKIDYKDLPQPEKDKDILHIQLAVQVQQQEAYWPEKK